LDNPNRSGIDWDSSSPNAFLLFLEKDDDASFDDESPFLTGRWADDDDMQSFFLLKAEDDDDKSVGVLRERKSINLLFYTTLY
tara:strand:- start:24 stop:272 length:249 start_codon:yes stop_codon:yes gene_type:complete